MPLSPGTSLATIVVAASERSTRDYAREHLEANGYAVIEVTSGEAVLQEAQNPDIKMILLDVSLEGPSGIECCQQIKQSTVQRGEFLPVVLLTAQSDRDRRVEGLNLGADDYMCKPFDERELIARVQNMVRIKRMHEEIHAARAQLEMLVNKDTLTELYNRRYFQERLDTEFKRAERYQEPLACVMIDLDDFRQLNLTYGYDIGDLLLKRVAQRLQASVRGVDLVARYAGEEFVILLPNTKTEGALKVAERVWRSIGAESFTMPGGREERLTVSIGIALFPSRGITNAEGLVTSAMSAASAAKQDGRDRICVHQSPSYVFSPTQ